MNNKKRPSLWEVVRLLIQILKIVCCLTVLIQVVQGFLHLPVTTVLQCYSDISG
ncbi:MAG TPA: hypothetical protein VHE34_10235 [Puia sp.]|uniref:hypothetical protein n=1 Tax=Puia sp. TaxID=2045100 RepID=UPI002BC89775|nr:hypothetical protein [Puia sp.]HVU95594.1 hypothetical protein [Puia sp.]